MGQIKNIKLIIVTDIKGYTPNTQPSINMPREIKDIKTFLVTSGRKDARSVKIMRMRDGSTKFKVRCSRYLYTLTVAEKEKAERLRSALPPGLVVKNWFRCEEVMWFVVVVDLMTTDLNMSMWGK